RISTLSLHDALPISFVQMKLNGALVRWPSLMPSRKNSTSEIVPSTSEACAPMVISTGVKKTAPFVGLTIATEGGTLVTRMLIGSDRKSTRLNSSHQI